MLNFILISFGCLGIACLEGNSECHKDKPHSAFDFDSHVGNAMRKGESRGILYLLLSWGIS